MSDAPADDTKPRIGAGDVPITLVDAAGNPEALVLRPNYNAARTISAQSGGLLGALDRVAKLDLETITQVITLGLGYGTQSARGPKDLPQRIYQTGLADDTGGLAERCVLYLQVLMGGGQPPRKVDDEGPR